MLNDKTINLSKGKSIFLGKGLQKMKIEVSWTYKARAGRALENFDVDLICLELDRDRRMLDYVFYNTTVKDPETSMLCTDDRAVLYGGDDQGDSGDGSSSEEMLCNLGRVGSEVNELIFMINIYDSQSRHQHFDQIKTIDVQVFEEGSGVPSIVYSMKDDYGRDSYIEVCSILRQTQSNGFEIKAIGEGNDDDLATNIGKYTNNINGNG
jgi:stress response protein SCP2